MEVHKSRSTQHLESWNNIDMTSWQSFHLIQSIVGWIWYSPRRDKLQEELNELQRGSLGDTGSVDKCVKCGRICAYSTTRILHRCLAAWFWCMDCTVGIVILVHRPNSLEDFNHLHAVYFLQLSSCKSVKQGAHWAWFSEYMNMLGGSSWFVNVHWIRHPCIRSIFNIF